MLSTYLTSVIIYTLIIWAEIRIFTKPAIENGWFEIEDVDEILKNKKLFRNCFILALVPVVRLFAAIAFPIIGFYKKEDIDNV